MKDYSELRQLSDALIEGSLDEQGKEKLEKMLLEDEEARKDYIRYSKMHSSLMHYASEQQIFTDYMGETSDKATKIAVSKPIRFASVIFAVAASLAIGFFISFSFFSSSSQPNKMAVDDTEPENPEKEEINEGYAVLLKAYQVEWGDGNPVYQIGDSIPKGHFKMKSGVVLVEFYSGTTMVLEGRTDLEIISPDKTFCHAGKMKVTVSPHAKGFTISTKDYDYVDLGTEFGLRVSPDKSSELHVFSGEVEVFEPGKNKNSQPLKTQKTGDAISLLANNQTKDIELKEDGFWNAKKLIEITDELHAKRFYEWKEYSKHISKKDGLIAYFPFYQTSPWIRKLENIVPTAKANSHGAIVGSQWIPGRWQEKSALLFKNSSDRVRFNIEGEFENLSLSAWVKVESLKNLHNGLFMTDHFKPGNPHWQIEQDGRIHFGIKNSDKIGQFGLKSKKVITPKLYGKWIHLAATFNGKNSQVKIYLNGKLIRETEAEGPANTKVKIGTGELGNWGLREGSNAAVRNFDGAIDEIQVYKSVLSEDDIWSLYEMGSPVLLLSKQ